MSNETKTEKAVSESSETKSKKKKRKKDRGVLPYLTTPLVYCLIALILVLPMFISFAGFAIRTVHKAQEQLTFDYNDAVVNSARFDNKTLEYDANKITACEKVGVLQCEKVGLITDVYFGLNRVSFRNGVGLSSQSVFDGYNSKLSIAGYSTGTFKVLKNISQGDVFVFETTDKIYEFTVVSNNIELSPEDRYQTGLILSCDEESGAFSTYNKEKRFVVAEITSISDKKGE